MPNRPPAATGTGLVSSHLIRAQMLSPSMSTCTEAGGPISLPPGSLAHSPPGMLGPPPSANPLTGRYGLGNPDWARGSSSVVSSAATAMTAISPIRFAFDMSALPFGKTFEWEPEPREFFTRQIVYSISDLPVEGDSFRPEKPRPWPEGRFVARPRIGPTRSLDLHPDGNRFALAKLPETQGETKPDKLVFNFFDELRRIAPRSP